MLTEGQTDTMNLTFRECKNIYGTFILRHLSHSFTLQSQCTHRTTASAHIVQQPLHTPYNSQCTHRTTASAHTVQQPVHTSYNSQCTHRTKASAHIVQQPVPKTHKAQTTTAPIITPVFTSGNQIVLRTTYG
jgi:hypothetical protein